MPRSRRCRRKSRSICTCTSSAMARADRMLAARQRLAPAFAAFMLRHIGLPGSALSGDLDRLYAERLLHSCANPRSRPR